MASDYDYLKELFNVALEPVKDAISELKNDVKTLNERLLVNRENYAKDLHILTTDIQVLSQRIDKIESSLINIEPKSITCQTNFEKKISDVKTSVNSLKEELNIIFLITKNPRLTIAILIGLYLLSVSDIFPVIFKNFIMK